MDRQSRAKFDWMGCFMFFVLYHDFVFYKGVGTVTAPFYTLQKNLDRACSSVP